MASSTLQAQCKECQNGVATCSGCRKQYCINHFQKHRQELAARMDEVGEEHDLLQQDLERENMMSELFSRIENWKQQSIKLIEDTAEQVRADLQKHFHRTKHYLKESLEKLTEKLKSSQLSNNYAEKQLDEWMRQLLQLRQMLEKPSTIDIVEDDTTRSSIHMIKVIDRSINEHDRMVRNMTTLSSSLPAASASSK
ncbi:unnamed protein product [Rotaria sp. Silwood2]|nr:unnamed protein product [Rotaria sp. Silwood2]CAF2787951.1 unnamed protein product [Rotaria sp. Silwood2]CAF3055691.1 unnamed protein product [Rotaria sp. Silwood2]CAF3378861.1 unnamed protein product [Rotaria sp. Silwood2]